MLALTLAAVAVISGPLKSRLDIFDSQATPTQANEVETAIKASPRLADQLGSLAAGGQFAGFRIEGPEQIRHLGPFSAAVDQGEIVFTADFLAQQINNRIYHVGTPNDLPPNNMTFDLGHLAYHIVHPIEQAHASARNPTNSMTVFLHLILHDEAAAYIQGWDDTLDAAVLANGGKPLTAQQSSTLLINLRYRFAFLKALKQDEPKLVFPSSGYIEASDQNIDALATALGSSTIADLQ